MEDCAGINCEQARAGRGMRLKRYCSCSFVSKHRLLVKLHCVFEHAGMNCEQAQAGKGTRLRRNGSHSFVGNDIEHEPGEHHPSGAVKSNLKRTASSISRRLKDLKFMVTHGKKPQTETDDEAFARCLLKPVNHFPSHYMCSNDW